MSKAPIGDGQLEGLRMSHEFGFGERRVMIPVEDFTHPIHDGDTVHLVCTVGTAEGGVKRTYLSGRVTRIIAEVEVD